MTTALAGAAAKDVGGSNTSEEEVRSVAAKALRRWAAEFGTDGAENAASAACCAIHDECAVLLLSRPSLGVAAGSASGEWQGYRHTLHGKDFRFPVASRRKAETLQVLSTRVLQVGNRSAASAQVRIVFGGVFSGIEKDGNDKKDNASESIVIDGWLVLLSSVERGPNASSASSSSPIKSWKVISSAFSENTKAESIIPRDASDVSSLVWDGYRSANRSCDGAAMARSFHPTCRLTYCNAQSRVEIKDSKTFCHKVQHRYDEEPPHVPYARLRNDARVSEGDSLLSIEFACKDIAMVVLRVGHPPFLWTDLLTCAKIAGRWWLVHKSSCCEPFMADCCAASGNS